MSALDFTRADPGHPAWRSPLARALGDAPDGIQDVTTEAADTLGPAAGVAGIELEGEHAARVLARLTELELDSLPAVGAVAEVRMLVERAKPHGFRIWFGQEFADYVAEVVLDAAKGVGWE
jgi:sarcosine oxidase gamma subunit